MRALEIFDEIENTPLLDYIGPEAAAALSILATHYSLDATKRVLAAFDQCFLRSPENTNVQSIPAMTDWVAVLEHRPQKFGTIWLFDENEQPFLPTVDDFSRVNERRIAYGVGPLRWPKSMVIPEENQLWLKQPITEVILRDPTEVELQKLTEFH